jgi:hypothetical protein
MHVCVHSHAHTEQNVQLIKLSAADWKAWYLEARSLAVFMALHKRLGQQSPLRVLDDNAISLVSLSLALALALALALSLSPALSLPLSLSLSLSRSLSLGCMCPSVCSMLALEICSMLALEICIMLALLIRKACFLMLFSFQDTRSKDCHGSH